MGSILLVIHLMTAIFLVVLILMQRSGGGALNGLGGGSGGRAGNQLVSHLGSDGQVLFRVDRDAVAQRRLRRGAVHDHVHRAARSCAAKAHGRAAGNGHQVEAGTAGYLRVAGSRDLRPVAQAGF